MVLKAWEVFKEGVEFSIKPVVFNGTVTNLNDVSKILPAGGYTTFRTFDHLKVIELEKHLSRLEETARLSDRPVSINRDAIRKCLRKAIDLSGEDENRVRISLDLEDIPGRIFITTEPLKIPSADAYRLGVRVITRKMNRNNPKAKLTNFIETASKIRKEIKNDVEEVLMVNSEGEVLEGFTSNFFAVMEGSILRTAESGVLSGITRLIVLAEAKKAGIHVQFEPVAFSEIQQISEAFITSSSRGVLPVTTINEIPVGDGKPGKITTMLAARYQDAIQKRMGLI